MRLSEELRAWRSEKKRDDAAFDSYVQRVYALENQVEQLCEEMDLACEQRNQALLSLEPYDRALKELRRMASKCVARWGDDPNWQRVIDIIDALFKDAL